MAKLDKRTIERILNEASLKGMKNNELSVLEAELYKIKELKNKTSGAIEFDKYALANKTLTVNVNLENIVLFEEVNWEYEITDKESKLSKHIIDTEAYGRIYKRYEGDIEVKFDSIHAEYLFDEKNTYYDIVKGELVDTDYLKQECKNNEFKLVEEIKKELFDIELLEKAGINLTLDLLYHYEFGGLFTLIERKITTALNNLYFQSYYITDDLLSEVMNIDKTVEEEMESCIGEAFGYFADIQTENLKDFAKERFVIAFAEALEEELEDFTNEGMKFLFEVLNKTSESFYKKVLKRENERLDDAYEKL